MMKNDHYVYFNFFYNYTFSISRYSLVERKHT